MRIVNTEEVSLWRDLSFWMDGRVGVYSIRLRGRVGRLGPEEIPLYKGLIHATVTLYASGSVCVCMCVCVCEQDLP